MSTPRYHVYDTNDWSGTSYTTTDREDALAAWRCNRAQTVEMVEFVPGKLSGVVSIMNDEFEEMLADENREAASVARHYNTLRREARVA